MKLTPPVLEACYDFLRATLPFRRWGLPPGEEVEFRVLRTQRRMGSHAVCPRRGHHVISMSSGKMSHTSHLVETMAHEMVHAYQSKRGTETRAEHNAEFRRLARIVCRHHGFDPLEF